MIKVVATHKDITISFDEETEKPDRHVRFDGGGVEEFWREELAPAQEGRAT